MISQNDESAHGNRVVALSLKKFNNRLILTKIKSLRFVEFLQEHFIRCVQPGCVTLRRLFKNYLGFIVFSAAHYIPHHKIMQPSIKKK